jgi:hypothetical protein
MHCKEKFSYDYKPLCNDKITCPYCGKSFDVKSIKYGNVVRWGMFGVLYIFMFTTLFSVNMYMDYAIGYSGLTFDDNIVWVSIFICGVLWFILLGIFDYLKYRIFCVLIGKFGFING